MGDFTRVKSPMKIHGRFYLSKKTPDYKMTHQLFTLFWIISNILTFSVIYIFLLLHSLWKAYILPKMLNKMCPIFSFLHKKKTIFMQLLESPIPPLTATHLIVDGYFWNSEGVKGMKNAFLRPLTMRCALSNKESKSNEKS